MKHQHALSINRYSAFNLGRLTSLENLAVHPRIQAIGGLSECRIGPGNSETLLSQAPVDYLTSEASKFTNGQIISVDGGVLATL